MITLATLPQATEQQVFDQVAGHLLRQGQKCTNAAIDGGACVYRSAAGLSCAAGCLIADSEYKKEMEYRDWDELVEEGEVHHAHQGLIASLQQIHDNYQPGEWPATLRGFAAERGLKYPAED